MSKLTPTPSSVESSGFGQQLAQARKKKSMSVQDVADELNILRRHVEAIEAQDFAALPAKAFVRGFVVNYAKLVGLDDEAIVKDLMAAYPKQKDENAVTPLKPMGKLHRGRAPIRLNPPLIAGVAALLLLLLFIIKMIGSATSEQQALDPQTQVVDSLSASEQAQGAAVGDAQAATANAESELDFWVKGQTRINVRDASGETLMSGEQNRGGYQVSGQAPFSIEIDNPGKVDLNLNKTPVDLARYTQNNKAVFTLQ